MRKLPDLLVGERHAAVGPVERLMDFWVSAANAVDTQAAAKRRVLGRDAMLLQGLDDGVKFCPTDGSLGMGTTGYARRRIIEAIERTVAAMAINPGYVENA